ncbi:MAG: BatD family protein [Candidatus Firestonebacteria bacterium]
MNKLFLLLVLACGAAAAEELTVSAVLDRNVVEAGGQLNLQVTVGGQATPALNVPALNDFNVFTGGQSRQSNISFVNGQMSTTTTVIYNYTLTPKGIGKFTIPSFTAEYKGKTYKSEPLQVEVLKGTAQPAAAAAAAGAATPAKSDDIFVQVTVNKNRVYVNEPVTLTFSLYSRVQLLGQPQYSAPDTTGFWKEDLPPQINTNRNGYAVTELKTALFPAAPGEYTIGKAALVCAVPSREENDFFSGFFARGKNIRLESRPVAITVLPLPAEGRPADFSGTVGRFNLSLSADKKELKTNDAVTLICTISGSGNIKTVGEPKLLLSDEFKKYETVTDMKLNKENYEVKGSKTFKTVLVPRKAGQLTLPAVTYSYFDYLDKKYKTLVSAPIQLNVKQGKGDAAAYAALPSLPAAEGVKLFGTDIRHIKQTSKFTFAKKPLYLSPLYLALNILPFAALIFIVLYRKSQSAMLKNAAYFKASRSYAA